jgi:nucleoside-diphosphate-sugar epimerase
MKIFVTGGTGFIGKHLVKKLQERGHTLCLLSSDLAEPEKWKKEISDFGPDAVVHLAWEGLPDYSAEISIKNLKYGLELFDLLAGIGCKTILSTGSCWEYGGQQGKLSEDAPVKNINAFTAAKNSLHWLGTEIARENNMQFIWTRLFYVYGPGQRKESLIRYLINCVKSGKTPEIKNPLAKNDFIYVEDVAEALSVLLENCKKSGVYNIGSGKLTSVKKIIEIVSDQHGLKNQYKDLTPRPTDVLLTEFYADISKIKKEIGWKPKTNIAEGIERTINYFKIDG